MYFRGLIDLIFFGIRTLDFFPPLIFLRLRFAPSSFLIGFGKHPLTAVLPLIFLRLFDGWDSSESDADPNHARCGIFPTGQFFGRSDINAGSGGGSRY
jgi:hypothetical protein